MKKSTKNNIIIIAMVVLLAAIVIGIASGRGNFALVKESTVTETVTAAASDMPAPDVFILSSEAIDGETMTRSETADEIFDTDQSDEDESEIAELEDDAWNLTEIADSELDPDDDQEKTEDIQEEDSEDDEYSLGENMQPDDTIINEPSDSSVWHPGHDTVIWTSEDGVVHYACNTDGDYKSMENGKLMCDQDHPCKECIYDDIMYCIGCGLHPENECITYSCRYCGDTYCIPIPEDLENDFTDDDIDEIYPEDGLEDEE